MKHLIAKEHHAHLKKRMILEFVGLGILIALTYNQRTIFSQAIDTIVASHWGFVIAACVVYWLLIPITPLSYRILAHRHIPLLSTALAQMSAAGPGRIIPGGLGHIAMGAEHLRKCRIPKQRALLVPLLNNIIGMFVTTTVLLIVVIWHSSWLHTLTTPIRSTHITTTFLVVLVVFGLALFAWHIRFFRHMLKPIKAQALAVLRHMRNHPIRIFAVCLLALVILFGHVGILMLVGRAIDLTISPQIAIVALSSGILLGSLTPTPGGLGGVEAGIVSSLLYLGFSGEAATSLALLFRLVTYWQPLIPGVCAYVWLRKKSLL